MSSQNRFADEFKKDAVAQVVDRGYAVSELAKRLGVSTKALYKRKVQFSKSAQTREAEADLAVELRRVPTYIRFPACQTMFRIRNERPLPARCVDGLHPVG